MFTAYLPAVGRRFLFPGIFLLIAASSGSFACGGVESRGEKTESSAGHASSITPAATSPGDAGQAGGGGPAPEHLAAAIAALPHPAGTTELQGPVADGQRVAFAFYWTRNLPEIVAAFYAARLPESGWQAIDAAPVRKNAEAKLDGTSGHLLTQRFAKGGLVLMVSVTPHQKDPALGQSQLLLKVAEES